jgi:class 3 adenylate cyclase
VGADGRERERIAEILREQGVPDDEVEAAIARGDPEAAILETTLTPAQAERTVSPAAIEAQGGLTAGEVADVVQAMGFPRPAPDDATLTPQEAQVFVELAQLRDVWPQELTTQIARMYGRLLARIARTGVQLFRLHSEPRVRAATDDRAEQLEAMRAAFERLGTMPDPLLAGVHRRWIEYEVAQSAISAVESLDPELGTGAVDVSLLFCDIKDFTAYATAEGDAAAVEAIDLFARTVDGERGEDGRIVKALGDGQMICYSDPREAVAAGARIIEGMRDHHVLRVHASVHRGPAITREGDYFGGAVNLAARLLNTAGRDELVATEPVVSSTGDEFAWESMGLRHIRGVAERVELFLLASRRRAAELPS